MIPRTFPSIIEAFQTKMVVYVLPSITGLKAWIDYIPVKGVTTESATLANTYANGGYQVVKSLDSLTGLQAWIGYIPVYEDASYNKPWSTDAGGYVPVGGLFSIPSLFASGAKGVWYDPSDLTTLFQDSAGTTPVTAVEQPVGRMLDKSGNGNHAFQSTSASRPVLSARYNLLTKTEQFDDAAWVKTGLQPFGSGSIVNATTAPDGTLTADFICENSSAGFHRLDSGVGVSYIAGTSLTSTIRVKSTTRNYSPYLGNASGAITATFNLSNGTVSVAASNIGTASGATASITQDAQGFWLCTLSGVVSTSSSTNAIFYHQIVSGTNASYTGDGTSGIFIWGASLVPANQSSIPYQRVNTATDYATTGFLPYLKFDGVDDSLSTNSISFTSTDKMSVFAGVRKLSSAGFPTILESSANVGSNAGTFNVFASGSTSNSPGYIFGSRGTSAVTNASVDTGYAAPVTNTLTGIGNIAADTCILRVNGTQVASNAADQGTGNYGNFPLYIGSRAGTSLPFNGQLYSMVIVGKAVTAGELSSTETYVNQKTGAY